MEINTVVKFSNTDDKEKTNTAEKIPQMRNDYSLFVTFPMSLKRAAITAIELQVCLEFLT